MRSRREPRVITASIYTKATLLAEGYLMAMAKRAYGGASLSAKERAGRSLVHFLRKKQWSQFTSREVRRVQPTGLGTQELVDMGVGALERADLIRAVEAAPSSKGGRPQRLYSVNPVIHRQN